MTEKTYKIGNVAKMLDLTVPGLRKWAQQYGDHLSAYANPGAGKPRRFTEQDVSTLQRIAKMRSDGALSHQDVKLRLDMESTAVEDEPPEHPQEPPQEPLQPPATIDAQSMAPLLTAIQESTIASERLREVSGRQDHQDRQIDQLRTLVIAGVFILALIAVLLVILIVVLR